MEIGVFMVDSLLLANCYIYLHHSGDWGFMADGLPLANYYKLAVARPPDGIQP